MGITTGSMIEYAVDRLGNLNFFDYPGGLFVYRQAMQNWMAAHYEITNSLVSKERRLEHADVIN